MKAFIKAIITMLTPKRPTVVRAEKRVISEEERKVLFFKKGEQKWVNAYVKSAP